MTITGTTERQIRVTLTVGGKDFGAWDKKTGGSFDTNPTLYNPASGPQIALKGVATTAAVVLSRIYDLERDQENMSLLYALAAHGATGVVKELGLDADGNVFAGSTVITGLLSNVTRPDADSTSSNPAMLSVTVTPIGAPVAS